MVCTRLGFVLVGVLMVALEGCGPSLPEVRKALIETVRKGELAAVKAKLDSGAEPILKNTALWQAAQAGSVDIVQYALALGAAVDTRDEAGRTALMHAAEAGHIQIVQLLLEKGAQVRQQMLAYRLTDSRRDSRGCVEFSVASTAGKDGLMLAIEHGHTDIVKLLLEKGSDPNVKLVWQSTSNPIFSNAFAEAVGALGSAGYCTPGAAPPSRERAATPLIRAVAFGHVNIVRTLLEYGANVNMTDSEGLTALMQAEKRGQTDIIRLLKK